MTYLTLLGVMALLKLQFLDVMSGLANQASSAETSSAAAGSATDFGGGVDTNMLSMLFFHAVTLQAIISSFIAGYIRNVELISGVKYAVALSTIALITWIAVQQMAEGGDEESAALLLLVAGGPARVRLRQAAGRARRAATRLRDRTASAVRHRSVTADCRSR